MNSTVKVFSLGVMVGLSMYGNAITAGTANSGECDPFTCNQSSTTVGQSIDWQQVYSSALFGSSPYTISTIQFPDIYISTHGSALVPPAVAGPVIAGDYLISFAYTFDTVGSLSTNMATNITCGETTFFSGPLATAWTLSGGLVVSGTPFLYNPTVGNLLIDIVATNQPHVPNFSGNGYLDDDTTGSVMSSAFDITGFP